MTLDARPTRRDVLRAGALASLGLAGCLNRATSPEEPEPPDGDAVDWTHWTGGPVRRRPTVADGVVYVGGGVNGRATKPRTHARPDLSENVVAVGAAEGEERWRYETPAGVVSTPVVRDGAVYAVVGWDTATHGVDQRLVRVDPDGSQAWSTDGVDLHLHLLGVDDDRAYLGVADDQVGPTGQRLFAVGTSDGREAWSVEAGDAWDGTLRGDTLYVEEGMSRTTARDVADGSERWAAGSSVSGEPRAFGDTLFVEAGENEAGNYPVVALDAADGSERWRFSARVDEPFVPTGAVADGDRAFVTEYGGWLFGLDREDGTERWRYAAEGETDEPPAVAGDALYLASDDGRVHAVDAATGERRWTASPGVRPRIAAASASGVVVRSGGEEAATTLRAYAPDGAERWAFSTAEEVTRSAVRGTRAYVATSGGHVVALDEP